MKKINDSVYKKIEKLSDEVKLEFRKKGIVIPIKNYDGSISLGRYKIVKNKDSFYSILDYNGDVVVDKINLPQTAALLANNMALGKWPDDQLLRKDRTYGYALFEESLYKKHAQKNMSKNIDRAQVLLIKSSINKLKKDMCKQEILTSFEKLRRFI